MDPVTTKLYLLVTKALNAANAVANGPVMYIRSLKSIFAYGTSYPDTSQRVRAQTIDATANVVIASFPITDNTLADFIVTVTGRSNTNTGDAYRADLVASYQRYAGGVAALVGAAAVPQNVRTNGVGALWASGIQLSNNTVQIVVTGALATTINWTASIEENIVTL